MGEDDIGEQIEVFMAKKKKPQDNESVEMLQNLLIVELAKAGVAQQNIRKIVGVDMLRVNKIARFFRKQSQRQIERAKGRR